MVWPKGKGYGRRIRRAGLALDPFAEVSFGQEGEDRVLARMFERQNTGAYVDVGAHHPRRFSNTYLLYRRGWSGLNIDPLPGTKQLFDRERPRDITVECAVASAHGTVELFEFTEKALTTTDSEIAAQRQQAGHVLAAVRHVRTVPLSDLVHDFLDERQVHVLTIDAEGRDHEILESAQLEVLKPTVICVESYTTHLLHTDATSSLMAEHGYGLVAATGLTRFYCRPGSPL